MSVGRRGILYNEITRCYERYWNPNFAHWKYGHVFERLGRTCGRYHFKWIRTSDMDQVRKINYLGIDARARAHKKEVFFRAANGYALELEMEDPREFIAFHRDMNSYRGMRHKKGLPVRGQRTHTNGKTVKRTRNRTVEVG